MEKARSQTSKVACLGCGASVEKANYCSNCGASMAGMDEERQYFEQPEKPKTTLLVHQPDGNYVIIDTEGKTFEDVGPALAWYYANYPKAKIIEKGKCDFWIAEDGAE